MQLHLACLLSSSVIFQAFAVEYLLMRACDDKAVYATGNPLNYCCGGYGTQDRFKYKAVLNGSEIILDYSVYYTSDCSGPPAVGPSTSFTISSICSDPPTYVYFGKVVKTFPALSSGLRRVT